MGTYAGHYAEAVIDLEGDALVAVPVNIYTPGTSSLATLYTDRSKVVQAPNPVTTSATGNLELYAEPGDYEGAAVVDEIERARFPVVVGDDPAEAGSQLAAHAAAVDPHPTYATDAQLASHGAGAAAHTAANVSHAPGTLTATTVQGALDQLAGLQSLPAVDWTDGETRPTTTDRVMFIVHADDVPPSDTAGDPHPGNPKPGDIVFTIPAGT